MALIDEILHGTQVPIEQEKVVDMKDVIYRLDPPRNPFLVFSNLFPKGTVTQLRHSWLEREGFARRTFKAKWIREVIGADTVIGIHMDAKYWNAVALSMAGMPDYGLVADVEGLVRLKVQNVGAGETTNYRHFTGYIKRSAYENGHTRRAFVNSAGVASSDFFYNAIQLSKKGETHTTATALASEAEVIVEPAEVNNTNWPNLTGITDGDECYVTVEFPNMQTRGHKQGSGLGKESFKVSRWLYNYPQIFKTPVSVPNTMQALSYIGGPERMKRRFESGQSHASDIEFALIFQGGGIEGTDWGLTDGSYNPLTRLKGLGVGHAEGKEGFIISNNGNPLSQDPTPMQMTAGDYSTAEDIMERLYDDISVGSQDKLMFTSLKHIRNMTAMATDAASPFTLMHSVPGGSVLGIRIMEILTSFGTLRMIHHPMFAGAYERYGVILDMKNITLMPLPGRDTHLVTDVTSKEIDGVTDEFRTELTLEIRHEHTHGIVYLKG